MLPDFPEQKRLMADALTQRITSLAKSAHRLLADIRETRYEEGDRSGVEEQNGTQRLHSFREIREELALPAGEHAILGFHDTMAQAPFLARSIAEQQIVLIHDVLDEATRHAGTQVGAGGRPLTADLYLEMLDRVQITFSRTGQPQLPGLYSPSPATDARFEAALRKWEGDPAFVERRASIIERNRVDWDAREADRRLVD